MFEVRESVTSVDDANVRTFEREAREGEASLEVRAGTTGLRREKEAKESLALLQIINVSSQCGVRVLRDPEDHALGFAFVTFGDDGILALLKALKFALKVLEDQVDEISD